MNIFRKKETIVRHSRTYNGSFLQPLAVAIVSAVLVFLILVMGFLDLRRSENNLVGFLQDQALATISVLQRLTADNLKSILAVPGKIPTQTKTAQQQESDYAKKLVLEKITALGQIIDEQWKKKIVSNAFLKQFAEEHSLWYVAILDSEGNAIYQDKPLDTSILQEKDLYIKGRKAKTIELLGKIHEGHGIGFVQLQRVKGERGSIVMALDKVSLRYWSMKVAVERGISKMGEGHGMVYLQIFNDQNKILGKIGQLPEGLNNLNINHQEILKGTKIISRKVDLQGKNILDVTAPFILDKKAEGIVRIGLERGSMDKIIAENQRNIFIFMLLVVVIALLSMWLLFHDQNRHLAGIIEMERRLEKAERLSSLGQLAAGVAHEIRNPLNAISMATQRLKRDFRPSDEAQAQEFQNLSGVIRDEIRRLNGIIEEFLSFSKSRRLELSDFSVTEVLQKIVSLLSEEAKSRGITIETAWNLNPAVIPMDINKLQQAFLNFIKNAMESIVDRGKISITVEKESKNYVLVSITDTGCGMTAEEIEKIFNPEYTTKEKGLGLGIPLAMEIIRGHGGDVRVISRKGFGTTFEIILPREKISDKT